MPSSQYDEWKEQQLRKREVFLQAIDQQRQRQADSGESRLKTGLALSGGGARGDFQVGALRWLVDQQHFGFNDDPAVLPVATVAGCSVGALNASKLAEGPGSLEGLEDVWRNISGLRDIYDHGPELAAIKAASAMLGQVPVTVGGSPLVPVFSLDLMAFTKPLNDVIARLKKQLGEVQEVLNATQQVLNAIQTGEIIPTTDQLKNAFNPVPALAAELAQGTSTVNSTIATLGSLIESAGKAVEGLVDLDLTKLSGAITDAVNTTQLLPGQLEQLAQDFRDFVRAPLDNLLDNIGPLGDLIDEMNDLTDDLLSRAMGVGIAPITGAITSANNAVALVNGILAGANLLNAHSLFRLKPLHDKVTANLDENLIGNSPVQLHVGFVSLETGAYRWADDDWPHSHLVNAIIASCAIPVVFAPVQMELKATGLTWVPVRSQMITWGGIHENELSWQGEHFVDGGLRALAPLAPVLHALKNYPGSAADYHLNQIFVFSCSSLTVPPFDYRTGYGTKAGTRMLNLLGRSIDLTLSTTLYENLGENHLEFRSAQAAAAGYPGLPAELASQFHVFHNAIVWAGGEPIDDFPPVGKWVRGSGSSDPMPGDTIIWLIDVDPEYARLRDALDFNATQIPEGPIIELGMEYGKNRVEWIMTGMNGPGPVWPYAADFDPLS